MMYRARLSKMIGKITGPEEPITAFFGVDAVIMLVATATMAWVFLTFATELGNILHRQYINIAFFIPKLTINGEPNSSMVVYAVLREMVTLPAFLILVFVLLFAVILDISKITNGVAKKMVWKAMLMMILVIVVPLMWDYVAEGFEKSAIGILNLTYSFDPTKPCKDPMPKNLLPLYNENKKIAERIHGEYKSIKDLDIEDLACSPQLRVTYLFAKALKGAQDFGASNPDDLGDQFYTMVGTTQKTFLFDFMGGITRATMVAFLTVFSGIVMIGKTLWIQSILTLLPALAVLSMFPVIGDFAKKMLKMIPGLLMAGIITAAVILAGSTTLSIMEEGIGNGEVIFGIKGYTFIETMGDVEDSNVLSGTNGSDLVFNNTIIFWFTAVAALALAATVPLMIVQELSSLAMMVGQMAGQGLISGAMTASNVVGGAVKGGGDGIKGIAGIGGAAGGGAASNIASNIGSPKGFGGGGMPSKDAMGAVSSKASGGKGGAATMVMSTAKGAAIGVGQGLMTDANHASQAFKAGSLPGAGDASRSMESGFGSGGGYFHGMPMGPATGGNQGASAAANDAGAAGSKYSSNHGDRTGGSGEGFRGEKIEEATSHPPTTNMESKGSSQNADVVADEIKRDLSMQAGGMNFDAIGKVRYEAGSVPPLGNLPEANIPVNPVIMPDVSGAAIDIPPGAAQSPGPLYSRTMSADWR